MATIREWLTDAGFDWEEGRILYQPVTKGAYSPGWAGDNEVCEIVEINSTDSILDNEFDSGYGAPQCPRFIAKDDLAVYFPGQYDGATFLVVTIHNFSYWLQNRKLPTPYPGG